jgi:hypothetical protein
MGSVGDQIEALFPGLRGTEWKFTSRQDARYNCIGWSAFDAEKWWWPGDPADGYFWPAEIERAETLAAFVSMYSSLGYEECLDASYEPGSEKIAIFASSDGVATLRPVSCQMGGGPASLGVLKTSNMGFKDSAATSMG